MADKVLLALLSAAVGALLGGVVSALVARYASFKESQAVAAALRAEIEVLLTVIERRDHITGLGRTISHLSIATGPPAPDDFYGTTGGTQVGSRPFWLVAQPLGMRGQNRDQFIGRLLQLREIFGAAPKVGIALMKLAPVNKEDPASTAASEAPILGGWGFASGFAHFGSASRALGSGAVASP